MTMNIFFRWLLVMILFSIYACATTPSQRALTVKVADIHMVKDCELLGEVMGGSSHAGIARNIGIPRAKNEAREHAAAMGATHILWKHIETWMWVSVTGNAYKCNK